MKYLLIVGFLFFSLAMSQKAHAQFFKKLADEVSERVENKVINDAGDAAVSGVDKAEKGTARAVKGDGKKARRQKRQVKRAQTERNAGNRQASALSRMMKGNAEKPEPWPEDYTLSITGSGNGTYMEYRMKVNGDQQSQKFSMNMNISTYAAPGKGARSESNIQIPMFGTMTMATIINYDQPNRVIVINERKKQYFIMDFSNDEVADDEVNFAVTNLGKETLFGLPCIHSKAITDDGITFELWTTRTLGNYEQMVELYSKSKNMGKGNLWQKMRSKDCDGIMVKMTYDTPKQGTAVMQLFEIERTTVSDEMLQVPAGYKESNSRWVKKYLKK